MPSQVASFAAGIPVWQADSTPPMQLDATLFVAHTPGKKQLVFAT
jgi:hypothetical protein